MKKPIKEKFSLILDDLIIDKKMNVEQIKNLKKQKTMLVREILPKLKANRYTYHNIDKKDVENFKIQYAYLKKHEDKKIFLSVMNSVNHWLNLKNELDFLKKIKSIQIISRNIQFNEQF